MKKMDRASDVDAVTPILYFAYGSNLDSDQMRRRCPSARTAGRMVLLNYTLAFVGRSKTWGGGGVATVVPEVGIHVQGLAYSLTKTDLTRLDRAEGYPGVYDRRLLDVIDSSDKLVTARVYIHTSQERRVPSQDYLAVIRAAYTSLGIDQEPLSRAPMSEAKQT